MGGGGRLMTLGRQDHDHAFAFELGFALGLGDFRKIGFEFFHEVSAEVNVGHLAAAEHDVELNLVPFGEEFFGLVHLGGLVVVVDADRLDAEFFKLGDVGGVGLLFFLFLFIFPFAVVHDAADGRLFHGRNFDEVLAGFAGEAHGFHRRDNADLFILVVDKTDGGNTNLFVATQTVLANGVGSFKTQ